jgi:hypothetical protein
MQKTITIPTHLSASEFGINDVDHFLKHVRGKELPVIAETKAFITVRDSTDEEWTINKGDLQAKSEKI